MARRPEKPRDSTANRRTRGENTTSAERERRINFVETLVATGRAQSWEQVQGHLEETLKVRVQRTAIDSYIKEAKNRLVEISDEMRRKRQEHLYRLELRMLNNMAASLTSHGVVPTYREFIEMLRESKATYAGIEKSSGASAEPSSAQPDAATEGDRLEIVDRLFEQCADVGVLPGQG